MTPEHRAKLAHIRDCAIMADTREAITAALARIAALESLVKDLADDLEAEVKPHYMGTDGAGGIHPALQLKYERDMVNVVEARKLLEGKSVLAEVAELRRDKERLDWLEANEMKLDSHREHGDSEFSIWWTVIARNGRSKTHPYGNARAAIDAAREGR